MFQEERLAQILSMINEKKFVTSEELKNTLYVSLSTVRRDLAELDRRGLIVRSHGGAIAKSEAEVQTPVGLGADPLAEPKTAVAQRAAELVSDGDVLFLSASSTVLPMAAFLREKKNLTVVTNSMQMVSLLSGGGNTIYGSGGLYVQRNGALYGNDAIELIGSFYYDKAFFSCHAISSQGVIGYNSAQVASVVKAAMLRAKKRICMFTGDKLDKTALRSAFTASQIDLFITDLPDVPRELAPKTLQVSPP